MKKINKIKLKGLVPRNSLVPMLFSQKFKSGSHDKPYKSVRQSDNNEFKKNLTKHLKGES